MLKLLHKNIENVFLWVNAMVRTSCYLVEKVIQTFLLVSYHAITMTDSIVIALKFSL